MTDPNSNEPKRPRFSQAIAPLAGTGLAFTVIITIGIIGVAGAMMMKMM